MRLHDSLNSLHTTWTTRTIHPTPLNFVWKANAFTYHEASQFPINSKSGDFLLRPMQDKD